MALSIPPRLSIHGECDLPGIVGQPGPCLEGGPPVVKGNSAEFGVHILDPEHRRLVPGSPSNVMPILGVAVIVLAT